jgi:hypothetical protein
VEQGVRRWQAACAIERSRGVAVCDTDPIKLHYIWSPWQIGVAAERVWQAEHVATRAGTALNYSQFGTVLPVHHQRDSGVLEHMARDAAQDRLAQT